MTFTPLACFNSSLKGMSIESRDELYCKEVLCPPLVGHTVVQEMTEEIIQQSPQWNDRHATGSPQPRKHTQGLHNKSLNASLLHCCMQERSANCVGNKDRDRFSYYLVVAKLKVQVLELNAGPLSPIPAEHSIRGGPEEHALQSRRLGGGKDAWCEQNDRAKDKLPKPA
eukprot:1151802-Pelagomonas_calceolata.AAC.5